MPPPNERAQPDDRKVIESDRKLLSSFVEHTFPTLRKLIKSFCLISRKRLSRFNLVDKHVGQTTRKQWWTHCLTVCFSKQSVFFKNPRESSGIGLVLNFKIWFSKFSNEKENSRFLRSFQNLLILTWFSFVNILFHKYCLRERERVSLYDPFQFFFLWSSSFSNWNFLAFGGPSRWHLCSD